MIDTFSLRVLQLNSVRELRAELERVGAELSLPSTELGEQVARGEFHIVKLERASLPLARLLYQELVIEGGQVVTTPRLGHVGEGETQVLLCATRYQFNHLLVRLRWQPSDELNVLADEIESALEHFVSIPPPLELGATRFDWTRGYIMGILNVTPDSFSGDALVRMGETEAELVARVVQRAHDLVSDGADLIDVGGESTRPGATPVDAETELARVVPVLRALSKELTVPISIDTSKAIVAEAALQAGAVIVNDVMGLRGDAAMVNVVASHHAAVVVMHNCKLEPDTSDTIGTILHDIRSQIELALGAGVLSNRILIDPGVGFGKSPSQNLEIINRVGEFAVLGMPILLGPSRKGFISKAIGVPEDEREEGTAAAVSVGILRGAHFFRVHDVKTMARIARMTDAIKTQSKSD